MGVMADDNAPYHGREQLATLSQENLLILDRDALRASAKARYYNSAQAEDSQETACERLEGDEEGRFAVASLRSNAAGGKVVRGPPQPDTKPSRQRRIKSAAPRLGRTTPTSRPSLSRRSDNPAAPADLAPRQRWHSRNSLSASSSTLLVGESTVSVGGTEKAAAVNEVRGPSVHASPVTRVEMATRRGLQNSSMQWSSQSSSRHQAQAERPHSSYTRPSSAAQRAKVNQLRRRSISEPTKLNLDVDDQMQFLLLPPPALSSSTANPLQASRQQPRPSRPQAASKRPQSAMPRLQSAFQPLQHRARPMSGSRPDSSPSSSDLSIQGQQLAVPTRRIYPGVLEEIDEEDQLQRELEEDEMELLWVTDPVAAREKALKETLRVQKLHTLQRAQPGDWRQGKIEVPDFHCDRCRDMWLRHGYQPEDCDARRKGVQKDWSWRRPGSGKNGGSGGRRGSVDPVPPANSTADLTDGTSAGGSGIDGQLTGDVDTDFHRTLSTIAGSEVGNLLKSSTAIAAGVDGDSGDGPRGGSGRIATGSLDGLGSAAKGGELDGRAFIGADGKVYVPDKIDGNYNVQGIPAHSGGSRKTRKSKSKRAKSAQLRAGSSACADADDTDGQKSSEGGDGNDGETQLDEDAYAIECSELDPLQDEKQTTRMLNGLRVSGPPPAATAATGTSGAGGKKSKKPPKEPMKLENIQDMFTRAFTFTYYVPSKAHVDETMGWKRKSQPGKKK